MNRKILAGLASVAVAAFLSYVYVRKATSNDGMVGEPVAVVDNAPVARSQIQSVTVDPTSIVRSRVHPFPSIPTSRAGLPLDNDPFVAGSVEEQRWLDRNGYPNAEQWRVYSIATDHALQQAADAGDAIAAVMLDARKISTGDKDAGTRLMRAAERGSTFALSLLSAYMAGSPQGDRRFGYALSRVQEMMGDTRVALVRDAMFRKPLSPQDRAQAEAQALQIFSGLQSRSSRRPFVDPRPFRG
jgi:hypothetical protein